MILCSTLVNIFYFNGSLLAKKELAYQTHDFTDNA